MNIIDAVKSGKPFKRKGGVGIFNKHVADYVHNIRHCFSQADILADDWEIEDPKVTISQSQFYTACCDVGRVYPNTDLFKFINALAHKLGLEP